MAPLRSQTLMDKYLKTADTDWYKQRITAVIVCALAAFVVLFIRLIYLQVIMGEEYRRLSLNNSIRLQNIDPTRGLIDDGRGRRLAENRPSFDVSITVKDAGDLTQTVSRLAGLDLTRYVERGYTSVRPEYRGMGIGTRLLEGLTKRTQGRKLYSIIAEDNLATQKIAIRNKTRKLTTFFSQKAGKQVGVWVKE